MRQSFDEDLALWADLGIDHVGLISPKLDGPGWDECRQAVLEAGLRVSSFSCYPEGIDESIEYSPTILTKVLYIVAGRATAFPWEKAAEEWCEAMTRGRFGRRSSGCAWPSSRPTRSGAT